MKPRLLYFSVFVFAALTAAAIWREAVRRSGPAAVSTAGLGMDTSQPLVPSAQEEKVFYGPEPLEGWTAPSSQPLKVHKKKRVASTQATMPSAALEATVASEPPGVGGVSLGFDAGLDYFIPRVNFQASLSPNWVLGLHLAYLQNVFSGPSAEMFGGGVNLSYYWAGRPLRGGFVDMGLAAYRITTATAFRTSFATPLATSVVVGWSGAVGKSLFYTLSAGGQYVHNFNRRIGDIQFDGFQPLVRTGLGLEF